MKLRRSLALASATAALAPVVLLAAPLAHATDAPSPAASESAPVETVPEETPAGETPAEETPGGGEQPAPEETTPGDGEEGEPGGSAGQPSDEETTPEDGDKDGDKNGDGDEEETPAKPSPSVTTSPSVSPSDGPLECTDGEEPKFDDALRTGLAGLPSKVVAGSGFHSFRLTVKNTGDTAYERVDLGVFAALIDDEEFFVNTRYLTLQFQDPASGAWKSISLDENDAGAGYLGHTGVAAGESFSVGMRLSVAADAPSGLGFALSIGVYADDEGNCVYAGDDSFYQFDVLAAGTKPGDVDESEPQGGSKPLPGKPSGDTPIDPKGTLAETGSDSALPLFALAGGAAVAVGAGAVFVVRRRGAGAAGAGTAA
ncbi:LAETG motif-containing sortase-dependent surface protein [Streptomyces sp. NPDC005805]|uniref:LAETG motif-containing sortase-dependent surface protein n=1 Tax=Streptomyces sp. NPDC005805 TaxID=3157068 RepID=UPI00340BE118